MSEPNPAPEQNEAPQWAREALSKANSEAAKYRVERNEYKQQLDAALEQVKTLTDGKTSAEDAVGATAHELLRLKVALAAGVPGEQAAEFAARLVGATEDELKADADKAKALFGAGSPAPRATDPTQGRGNDGPSTPSTPQAEFAQLFGNLDIFKR